MSFTVSFWRFGGWREGEDKPFYQSRPSSDIYDELDISKMDLFGAFQSWINDGSPQGAYKHKINDKKYIRLYHDPETFNLDGSLSITRPWGNHWRRLSSSHISYTLDPVLKEPPQ